MHDWNESKNWKKFPKKLHENFRHPKNWRLKELMLLPLLLLLLVGTGKWQEDTEEILE